jgi:hypothetical protein
MEFEPARRACITAGIVPTFGIGLIARALAPPFRSGGGSLAL